MYVCTSYFVYDMHVILLCSRGYDGIQFFYKNHNNIYFVSKDEYSYNYEIKNHPKFPNLNC